MLIKKPLIFLFTSALIYIAFLINSCKQDHPDIDEIPVTISASRFETELFTMDPTDIQSGITALKNKYGNFFNLYAFQVMSLGARDSQLMNEHFKSFITDSNFRAIYNDCKSLFGNFEKQNKELSQAFRYYAYYFPGKIIPDVITMISGFSYPIVCDSTHLGISLDMYLGPQYKFYSTLQPPLPVYLRNRMHKDYLVCDAMKGWAESDYGIDESSAIMIDFMIANGRILYFLDKILPETPDSIRAGYTADQMKWCNESESRIWSFFIENKLLFSNDPNLMNKYVNEGPTTNGFPKESPGNIGKFIGWQIVRSYMKNHPDLTLQQLMEEKDMMKIYNESKYKPAK
jgi:gliding motility-associated lipoprotein GldB